MVRSLLDLIYGKRPADFPSAFSLDESVKRLAAATERSVFKAFSKEAAVGQVSRDRVSLQRVIPLVGNSFKPYYVGMFRETGGQVTLTGHFTMHSLAKAFLTFWFGFCLLWTAQRFCRCWRAILTLGGSHSLGWSCLRLVSPWWCCPNGFRVMTPHGSPRSFRTPYQQALKCAASHAAGNRPNSDLQLVCGVAPRADRFLRPRTVD